jgi:hypothetical protein
VNERRELDTYYTPDEVAGALVGLLPPAGPGTLVLEPHVGGGAFARAARTAWRGSTVLGIDLSPSAPGFGDVDAHAIGDFLEPATVSALARHGRPEVIIGNPPFSEAQAHIKRALGVATSDGWVGFLLRLALLESSKRLTFWRRHPPRRVWALAERPSFTGGGTDVKTAYGFFWWDLAWRGDTTLGWVSWKRGRADVINREHLMCSEGTRV